MQAVMRRLARAARKHPKGAAFPYLG
jgi:hypothetical protein